MARPVDLEKRRSILEAAADAFLEDGFAAATIDQIADASGVARRTVYHQFESKDGLFAAVVDWLWSELNFDAAAGLDEDAGPEITLFTIANNISEYWRRPRARRFLRLIIMEGPQFPELLETFYKTGKAPVFRNLSLAIQKLAKQGKLRSELVNNSDLAAHQLVGLLNEPLLWPVLLGAPEPEHKARKEAIQSAVAVFLNYWANGA